MADLDLDRRSLFALGSAALAGSALPARASVAAPHWGRGIEGQRRADLGNGTFRNPVLAGD